MKINLKRYAKLAEAESVHLHIDARLPAFIQSPCDVTCLFRVEAHDDYHLLFMEVSGTLPVICQRCLELFDYAYHHQTTLAVCRTDSEAAQYMSLFECMIAETGEVDLLDVVTDELHLCCPEKHEDPTNCYKNR